MNALINSIRNILIPYLEQDSKYEIKMLNDSFCELFANAIIRFENDPKQVNEILQSLELANIGIIKSNLSEIHKEFLNELAEYYVLGYSNVLTDYLLKSANLTFEYYVNNFRNIENSIKKTERNRLKLQLPHLHDRLVFELSDNEISNAFKKKGREDLKTKFKKWDYELLELEEPIINTNKIAANIINMSWFKYAVAACLLLTTGLLFYLKNNDIPTYSEVIPKLTKIDTVISDNNKINEKKSILKLEKQILFPLNLGFVPEVKGKTISIIFIDSNILENGTNYTFYSNELVIYKQQQKVEILSIDGKLMYLKLGKDYYYLKETKTNLILKIITKIELKETLDKIVFENE